MKNIWFFLLKKENPKKMLFETKKNPIIFTNLA
jgi:hypothetical protein